MFISVFCRYKIKQAVLLHDMNGQNTQLTQDSNMQAITHRYTKILTIICML